MSHHTMNASHEDDFLFDETESSLLNALTGVVGLVVLVLTVSLGWV